MMVALLGFFLMLFTSPFKSKSRLEAENAVLRLQLAVLLVALGEGHLRRILQSYARYYNESRTHRSLSKDAPVHRAIENLGAIISRPVLGGLHHRYCRI
jgi:hypothetical protein